MRAPLVPSAEARVYVAAVGEEENPVYSVAHSAGCSGKRPLEKGQEHEDWTSASLEKSPIEVEEGHTDAGMGMVAVEAVHRPIDRKDNVEVAFEAICAGLAELSLRGKLDVNRVTFVA
jgi:hypothetical protein